MLKFLASKMISRFERRYDYDVSYMRYLLDVSPAAFFRFNRVGAMARQGESAPAEALFAARLCGVLAEDCGPCVQLIVSMAQDAGVDAADLSAILQRDADAMSPAVRIAFDFADAVLWRNGGDDAAREAARREWGDAGIVDLTFALQASRLYPMVKAGLGFGKTCRQVTVEGAPVEVVKHAA
ncbi:hypothetical protein [Hyphococcus luteus]|uniref:Carboxymuconolactone decarboxylase-like domain-containing protein n=1 Tax=Hyphococcus luteus TaxID=2058213 RepID=A0A2S7JZU6_9PROT|nr:hypothetical protein [Marinicaulis flavus]PQA85736.1 hypothetical protein CW354_22690 [Marinicaulis flavus]